MLLLTDTQIKEDLNRELRHNSRFGAMSLEVEVNDYVITLSGAVETANDRMLAQEVACGVEGIHGVVNNIKVRNPAHYRTDEEIARALRNALEWDAMIPDEEIQSSVSNGWVGLEGTVTFIHERENAERMARRLVGVRGVYNEIVVRSDEVREENVRDTIEDELRRLALLEAQCVKVTTRDGEVIISGCVQSWAGKRAILSAASRAPGVGVVRDYLTFEPS